MDELAEPAIEVVKEGRVRFVPEGAAPRSTSTGWSGSGPGASRASSGGATGCPSGTAATTEDPRSTSARSRPRARAGSRTRTCSTPGSARRCGRSRRSAGRTRSARTAGLLPDRRALDGAGHHLPLGRADDHDLARVHRRGPVRRRLRPLGDPGARRPADVEVARDRDRPARRDRRARRRRAALRPAGDVLDPGRPLLAGPGPAGARPRQQDVERVAADPAERAADDVRREPRERPGRGPLDRLPPAARDPLGHASRSRPTTSPTRSSTSTSSSGPSSATGTWRSSSRGSTTATRTPRRRCCGRWSRCSRWRIR